MVDRVPSPSPGLEEGGQANQRCSMLGSGLRARAGLMLVQACQRSSFLLSLGFKIPADIFPMSGDLHVPGGNELKGGFSSGEKLLRLQALASALVESIREGV